MQIEANVDDLTGELAAHAIEALLAAGALDAWAVPITMKKGRPALTIAALATVEGAERVAAAMLTETTTIGVRKTPVSRTERPRRIATVETPYGSIRVKISEGPFGPPQVKPETDDCAAAARTHGVPLREVLAAALAAALR
ncbi:MAG: nickel insertion protein [Byssovorax sp.]